MPAGFPFTFLVNLAYTAIVVAVEDGVGLVTQVPHHSPGRAGVGETGTPPILIVIVDCGFPKLATFAPVPPPHATTSTLSRMSESAVPPLTESENVKPVFHFSHICDCID